MGQVSTTLGLGLRLGLIINLFALTSKKVIHQRHGVPAVVVHCLDELLIKEFCVLLAPVYLLGDVSEEDASGVRDKRCQLGMAS